MGLVINTNIASLVIQRRLRDITSDINESFERLSTGLRINKAADDPAGLIISENLRAQYRGIEKAKGNVQDANSLLQVAEGDLSIIESHLQRIRDLTVQAGNDTNSQSARTAIQAEITARMQEIDRLSNSSDFNGINLLDGSAGDLNIQVGPKAGDAKVLASTLFGSTNAAALGLIGNVNTASAASAFLDQVDSAINTISSRRGSIGTEQNIFDGIYDSLSVRYENLVAADSRIRDVDIAAEVSRLIKNQILQQVAVSLLAQANQAPAIALQLI